MPICFVTNDNAHPSAVEQLSTPFLISYCGFLLSEVAQVVKDRALQLCARQITCRPMSTLTCDHI